MLKAIGICLTVVSCGGLGLVWARNYEQRPSQLMALESALQLLETEIIYGATPMEDAMELVANRCDKEIRSLFEKTADQLKKMNGITAGEAWNKALEKFYPETALNKSDYYILKRMGAVLGCSDREDQTKHLELTKSQLKMAAKQAEALARKNAGMFKYLGFLGGLFLVLIIY